VFFPWQLLNPSVGASDSGHFVIRREDAAAGKGVSRSAPLMHASLELKPLDGKADARVTCEVDRLVLRLDAPWLAKLAGNFAPPQPEFLLDLQVRGECEGSVRRLRWAEADAGYGRVWRCRSRRCSAPRTSSVGCASRLRARSSRT
jgi:hypothetical protein